MSYADMVRAARGVGLSGSALTTAVAISLAEDPTGDPAATHHNTDGSTDYGYWQINSVHGFDPKLLTTDPVYQADAMKKVSNNGTDWSPWATYPAKAQASMGQAATLVKQTPGTLTVEPIPSSDMQGKDPIGDAVTAGGNAVLHPLKGIDAIAKAFGSIASHLLDSKWWLRIGQGMAGAALLLIALGLIFRKQIVRGGAAIATDGLSEAT